VPLVALATAAFAAGALAVTVLLPRDAHAIPFASTIQVPVGGLTFRAPDGRAIARLTYDARGGVFEVLDENGGAVSSMGHAPRPSALPVAAPPAVWSVDELRDPWARDAVEGAHPASGL
jgi:hypothetical protein